MMLLRQSAGPAKDPTTPTAAGGQVPAKGLLRRLRRRGATMMEYLVCLSFIIAVVILAIQHVGLATGTNFQTTATTMPDGTGTSGS